MATVFHRLVNNAVATTTGYSAAADPKVMTLSAGHGARFGDPSPSAPRMVSTFLADGTPVGIYSCEGRDGDDLTDLTLIGGDDADLPSLSLVQALAPAELDDERVAALLQFESDLEDLAADVASLGDPAAALAAHVAAGNPHPQYLTQAEGDAAYSAIGHNHSGLYQPLDATLTSLAALDGTAGLLEQTGADAFARRALGVGAPTSVPTRADADARYDAAGEAASVLASLAAHEAAGDPHPQYLTVAEGNSAYAAAVHSHAEGDVTGLTASLAAKAPLSNPALTGTPTAPTAAGGTNTTQIATTAFVLANSVSLAVANVFTQDQAVTGKVIARQSGGVAGTDEVQLSHDGTRGLLESKDGYIEFHSSDMISGRSVRLTQRGGGAPAIDAIGASRLTVDGVLGAQGSASGWEVASTGHLQPSAGNSYTLRSSPASPAQITGNVNNYNPGIARHYYGSTDADGRRITGLILGLDGEERWWTNAGSFTAVFAHQDTNSTAANRFDCEGGADVTVPPRASVRLLYRTGSVNRWLVYPSKTCT